MHSTDTALPEEQPHQATNQDHTPPQPTATPRTILQDTHGGSLQFSHVCRTNPGGRDSIDGYLRYMQWWHSAAMWTPFEDEHWTEGQERPVAALSWLLVDLAEGMPAAWDELDGFSAETSDYGEALFLMEAAHELPIGTPAVMILGHAHVAPDEHGTGVGRLLALETVDMAMRGGREAMTVLCRPQPDGWETMPVDEYVRALGKVRQVWESIGFRPSKQVPDMYVAAPRDVIGSDFRKFTAPVLTQFL